jgi:hypothetical protein
MFRWGMEMMKLAGQFLKPQTADVGIMQTGGFLFFQTSQESPQISGFRFSKIRSTAFKKFLMFVLFTICNF